MNPHLACRRRKSPSWGRVLSTIRDHGATIILVEHNFRMIQSLADTIVVLDQGALLARGSVAEIQANEEVARIYLGMEPRAAQLPNAESEGVTGG